MAGLHALEPEGVAHALRDLGARTIRAEERRAANRPRVELGLAIPSPQWLPGNIAFEAAWEQQSYAVATPVDAMHRERESRRRSGLRISDWPTGWMRWRAGAALDRFDARDFATADAAVDIRLNRDHGALSVAAAAWTPLTRGDAFATGALVAAWRSTTALSHQALSVRGSITMASASAPRALWPGAGTGPGRPDLLRAHPLLRHGVIDGPVFGRVVSQATAEYARPIRLVPAGAVAAAVFVDAARAWRRIDASAASPLYVDAGVGIRVRVPGARDAIRLDVAHGLRGGGVTFSAGWAIRWTR